MPPTRGARKAMMKKKKAAGPPAPRKSVYEKVTGRKNPEWADKVFNSKQFPSLYERITGKEPR